MTKNKICIIHGFTSHKTAEWFPWLAEQLTKDGMEVLVPEMPNSDDPILSDWLQCMEKTLPDIDENTILVGHSLGCITALRYLLHKGKQVKGLVLVSGFIDQNPMRVQSEHLSEFTDGFLNIEQIKRLAPIMITITARDDDIVPSMATVDMADKLQTELVVLKEGKHFIARDGYTSFPILYDIIKNKFS